MKEPFFNARAQNGSKLSDTIIRLFKSAVPGSRVFGSVMVWTDEDVSEQIFRVIDEKRLQVSFVTGSNRDAEGNPAENRNPIDSPIIPQNIKNWFQSHNSIARNVNPAQKLNHSKWFVFEQLDPAILRVELGLQSFGDTVFSGLYVSSGNLGPADRKKHNAAVLTYISFPVVTAMRDYYDVLFRSAQSDAQTRIQRFARIENSIAGQSIILLPRAQQSHLYAGIFPKVGENAKITIVTTRFRNEEIADALHALRGSVRVKIICRPCGDDEYDQLPELSPRIFNKLKDWCEFYFPKPGVSIHSKYLCISGKYKVDGHFFDQKNEWIGTANLTNAGQANHWEQIVKISNDASFYEKMMANVSSLKQDSVLRGR